MNLCHVEGCEESYYAKSLCLWHYQRVRKGDTASLGGPRPWTYCETCGERLPKTSMRYCPKPECQPLHIHLDTWVNPLVCDCAEPDADPRVDFGMCQTCKRKPLALFLVNQR